MFAVGDWSSDQQAEELIQGLFSQPEGTKKSSDGKKKHKKKKSHKEISSSDKISKKKSSNQDESICDNKTSTSNKVKNESRDKLLKNHTTDVTVKSLSKKINKEVKKKKKLKKNEADISYENETEVLDQANPKSKKFKEGNKKKLNKKTKRKIQSEDTEEHFTKKLKLKRKRKIGKDQVELHSSESETTETIMPEPQNKKSRKNKYKHLAGQPKLILGLESHTSKAVMLSKKRKSDTDSGKHVVSSKKKRLKDILVAAEKQTPKKTDIESDESSSETEDEPEAHHKVPTFKEKMQERLKSAHFRYLNEQLYTQTGQEAYKMFSADPESYKCYHEGFQTQLSKWPKNPVNRMIQYIKKRPSSMVVADFGCGEAQIARTVPNKVYSFDLVALNKHVTPCNMSNVPLGNNSVDIAVFCLSLMGTNLKDFLLEASRVLKNEGKLLIAEVVSRFESIASFVSKLSKFGFNVTVKDTSNKMFVWLEFKKTRDAEKPLPSIELMPCLYKKR